MIRTQITYNTEKLLKSRSDDYRIDLIRDVLFGEDFCGSHPNREFTFKDSVGKEMTASIRKACIYDTLQYDKVSDVSDMSATIESNIANIQRIKKNSSGVTPIKDVWVILFTTNKEGEDLSLNAYFNPDANDCSDIIHSERLVIMVGFIITYAVDKGPNPEALKEVPDEVYEFNFISPMDSTKLNEYGEIALEEEAKQLQNMFLIKFNPANVQ